jgi:VanZ family protein
MRRLMILWLCLWALFSIPWTSETATPQWDRVRPPHVRQTSRLKPDHVLNVLFYVPFAPLGAALGWPLPALVAAGGALSVSAETLQLFSTERNPDGNDIIANVLGTAIGAGIVVINRRRSARA